MGKKDLAHKSFVKNIDAWHKEYLENGLDAIISNTSGCGTTLKDYDFIFRNDKEMFNLQCWALTANTLISTKDWKWIFNKLNFKGDYEFIYFK